MYRVYKHNSVCFELLVSPGFSTLGQLIVLFGVLSSGNLTYDPLIWSKVTSLFSTASKKKGAKKYAKKEFECTKCKDTFNFFPKDFARLCLFTEIESLHLAYLVISLASKASAASITSTASMTSVASMTSTASFHQKTY